MINADVESLKMLFNLLSEEMQIKNMTKTIYMYTYTLRIFDLHWEFLNFLQPDKLLPSWCMFWGINNNLVNRLSL